MVATPDLLRMLRQENSRLKEDNQALGDELLRLRNTIRSLSNLQRSLDLITPQTDPNDLLKSILWAALDAVDSKDGSLMLLDDETGELVFVYVIGASQQRLVGYRLPKDKGIASWVVANHRAQLVPDVSQDPRFNAQVDQHTGFRTTSLICVPLIDSERSLGAIEIVNTSSGKLFVEADLDIMLLVARLAVIAILRAEGSPHIVERAKNSQG